MSSFPRDLDGLGLSKVLDTSESETESKSKN
jgi:hypothetical protein